MKRKTTIVKDINKMFPAYNKDYPVAFIVDDEVKVTSESFAKEIIEIEEGKPEEFEVQVVDYYGEYKGGYPWLNPRLETYIRENDLWFEWENAGAIVIYRP